MNNDKEEDKADTEEVVKADSKRNVANVVHTVKLLFNLQTIFGVSVFQMVNGELKRTSWIVKILSALLVLVYCLGYCLLIMNGYNHLPQSDTKALVAKVAFIPGALSHFQYFTTVITSSFLVDKTIIKLLNAFAELDTLLRIEKVNDFYKKSRLHSIVFLLLLGITHSVNCILSLVTSETFSLTALLILPIDFFLKFQIVLFCRIILMLRSRLTLINEYVATFVEIRERKYVNIFTVRERKIPTEAKYNFIGRASDDNTKIRDIATMYDQMGKICMMINETWNFKIFMALISTFTFIVITMWTSLYYYQKLEDNWGPLINIAIWCFSAIYTVAVMSITCERLLLARNEAKVIVNKVIMNYDLPKTMRVQAKAYMELIEAWPLRIYIYDMFSVDITLMLKFISVATTYLIVIIQISHFI